MGRASRLMLLAMGSCLLLLAEGVTARPEKPARRHATPEQIDAAIRRAIDFLYAEQTPEGTWELQPTKQQGGSGEDVKSVQWGGRTALVTYALLSAGESPSDPRLQRGIEFLKKANAQGTMAGYYALGLRAQVWLYLPPTAETRKLVERDAALLLQGVGRAGDENAGLYDYTTPPRPTRIDMSVSQYGVLGMWACQQLLPEIKNQGDYWERVDKAWKRQQSRDNGWAYDGRVGSRETSLAMTAAGVATLFITQDYLDNKADAACVGNKQATEIANGIAYLAEGFPKLIDPSADVPHRLYTLYGVERIGVASGLKYLNGVDWFREGATALIDMQGKSGAIQGEGNQVVGTSFSLLFLSRGRAPVMMNKIDYDVVLPAVRGERPGRDAADPGKKPTEPAKKTPPPKAPAGEPKPADAKPAGTKPAGAKAEPADLEIREGSWNQRPRDLANATHYVSRSTERLLNWQVIDLAVATVDDLSDAPIAYFAAGSPMTLSAENKQILREYVESGGVLLFNIDCKKRPNQASVERLIAEILPGRGEMKSLELSHPVFTGQQFPAANWKTPMNVRALTNGARLLAVVAADDPARGFQLNNTTRDEPFQFVTNLYQYSIDRTHALSKGRSYRVKPDPAMVPTKSLTVARLKYNVGGAEGNWDPEPGGWRRMAAIMRNSHKLDLKTETVDLAGGDLSAFQVAHLTGAGQQMNLTAAELAKLRSFVEGNGLLLIEAAGGSAEFKTSIESQLKDISPNFERLSKTLDISDPLYTAGGQRAPEVRYRPFAVKGVVGQSRAPRIRGLSQNGRLQLLYSPEDLSVGMVGVNVDGISGYESATATDIMSRILLHAQASGKP